MSQEAPSRPVEPVVARPDATKPAPTGGWVTILSRSALVVAGIAVGAVGSRLFLAQPRADNPAPEVAEKCPAAGDEVVITLGPEKRSASGIESVVLVPEPLVSRVWRTGRVSLDEDRLAHIYPLTEGIVREVRVALGQTVAAGDVLAVIDSRELGQAKLDAYRARIALAAEQELAARTRTTMANADELLKLLAAEASLDEIEKRMADKPIGEWRQQLLGAYTRRKQLQAQLAAQRASAGDIPESTVRKTEAELAASQAAYTALFEELKFQVRNQVRQAELRLREAETNLDVARSKLLMLGLTAEAVESLDPIAEGAAASHLVMKAPFPGTVLEKHAVRSERVGPQMQMFVIADLSNVWVQADLFEADLPLVRGLRNRPVVFRSATAGIPERTATVVNTGTLIDRASRTLTLIAEADNADRVLKPGLFVEVGFDTSDPTPVLQLPSHVILRHENKPFVFVQEGEDRFRRVDVTLGRTAGEKVEVTGGLKPGDRVVVRGGFVLKSELLKDQMVGE
jgi:cobalt-zinc-cadmium efflux system membrane fusion protein